MAIADLPERADNAMWPRIGLAFAALVSVVVSWASLHQPAVPAATTTAMAPTDAVYIADISAVQFDTLTELVTASDTVMRATVIGTARGRAIGTNTGPNQAIIVSRVLTLRVDEVLAGSTPPGAQLLVEEEGWLSDGRPIAVNGATPTANGDSGIWFLTVINDPEMTGYIVTNGQGRYLHRANPAGPGLPTQLEGADRDDPLVQRLQRLTPHALAAHIRQNSETSEAELIQHLCRVRHFGSADQSAERHRCEPF